MSSSLSGQALSSPRSPVASSSRAVLDDFSGRPGGRQSAMPAFSDLLRSPGGNHPKRKVRESYGDRSVPLPSSPLVPLVLPRPATFRPVAERHA